MLFCSQIPDFSKNTHEVFLALDKRGDFKIWQDEFESLCDVVVVEIERQRRKRRVMRSRAGELLHVITELRIITEPAYDLIIWALTLASVVIAICEGEVCCCNLTLMLDSTNFRQEFSLVKVRNTYLFRSFTKPCGLNSVV